MRCRDSSLASGSRMKLDGDDVVLVSFYYADLRSVDSPDKVHAISRFGYQPHDL